jgi:pimeloyl-ACP methyl ester carboxylesterase
MGSVDSGYTEVNDARLYYEVAGQGIPIVLIHGFTVDTRMWDDQFQEFSKHYRVIRYDSRGFGRSSVPEEGKPYSHSRDLKGLLDHLNVRKTCVIGLSMGGRIAINFTLEYTDYVSSLITVDSVLGGYGATSEFREWYASLFRIARDSGVESAKEAFMDGALFESAMGNPLVADRLRELIGSYSGWRFVNDDPHESLDPSSDARLCEIRCPTLVVIGEYDIPTFQGASDRIADQVSGSRKVVIPGVGHMSNMEDPETFNNEILSFLESLKREIDEPELIEITESDDASQDDKESDTRDPFFYYRDW